MKEHVVIWTEKSFYFRFHRIAPGAWLWELRKQLCNSGRIKVQVLLCDTFLKLGEGSENNMINGLYEQVDLNISWFIDRTKGAQALKSLKMP